MRCVVLHRLCAAYFCDGCAVSCLVLHPAILCQSGMLMHEPLPQQVDEGAKAATQETLCSFEIV